MKIYCFLGLPASGKGTQVDLFLKKRDALSVGIGELVRGYIKNHQPHDDEYNEVVALYNDGKPAKDEFVFKLIKEKLASTDKDTIVFDNYPFTQRQSELLDEFIAQKSLEQPTVLYIDIDPEIVIQRMLLRLMCPKCGKTFISSEHTTCPDKSLAIIRAGSVF